MDFEVSPLPGAGFGAVFRFPVEMDTRSAVATLEAEPTLLSDALDRSGGLLLFPGLHAIAREPELLVRLSRLFGPEVENYRQTLSEAHMIHPLADEIYVLGNRPPSNRQPPAPPDPPRSADGGLPVQFPHRKGWHTDQSFRRPPPDISLFYAVIACPKGQGQTLFADGVGAYESLPAALKERIEDLEGVHVYPFWGRSEEEVRAGVTPRPLAPHEQPQRQPVVREHPVTGKCALYLCATSSCPTTPSPASRTRTSGRTAISSRTTIAASPTARPGSMPTAMSASCGGQRCGATQAPSLPVKVGAGFRIRTSARGDPGSATGYSTDRATSSVSSIPELVVPLRNGRESRAV